MSRHKPEGVHELASGDYLVEGLGAEPLDAQAAEHVQRSANQDRLWAAQDLAATRGREMRSPLVYDHARARDEWNRAPGIGSADIDGMHALWAREIARRDASAAAEEEAVSDHMRGDAHPQYDREAG